jgi:CxxC motif-containing protein (DUF1111 family)
MKFQKIQRLLFLSFGLVSVIVSCKKAKLTDVDTTTSEWLSGGSQTHFVTGAGAFGQPFNGLSGNSSFNHELGDAAFEANFLSDPTQVNYGLGPIYNNQNCVACHGGDGRGKAPEAGGPLVSLLLRISVPGQTSHGDPNPVPNYGGQLQHRSIYGVQKEADVIVSYTENTFSFPDGETYSLRTPTFTIVNEYLNSLSGVMVSPRLASPVFGLGLLEAISEIDILANVDENDANNDGISGKANNVYDYVEKRYRLGRFGWKASQPSVIQQSAGAYVEDMGITNFIFPKESSFGQSQFNFPNNYDLYDSTLYAVAHYIKTLGVPARRNIEDEKVRRGKALFNTAQCASCHKPRFRTATNMLFKEASNQVIFPYTDLLLHDLGFGLADNRPDNKASGVEWRTPPLWGIGLTAVVNGNTNFLHDGRARNFVEAIMWHGGEAENSKNIYKAMTKADRDAIKAFLNSL